MDFNRRVASEVLKRCVGYLSHPLAITRLKHAITHFDYDTPSVQTTHGVQYIIFSSIWRFCKRLFTRVKEAIKKATKPETASLGTDAIVDLTRSLRDLLVENAIPANNSLSSIDK